MIANDTARPGVGIGKLVDEKLIGKAIVSHIGLNPETQRQMIAGTMEVELVPQGTLIERIRAGGYGLGGVLTSTGRDRPFGGVPLGTYWGWSRAEAHYPHEHP